MSIHGSFLSSRVFVCSLLPLSAERPPASSLFEYRGVPRTASEGLDDSGAVEGELLVSGRAVAFGYGNEELSAAKFVYVPAPCARSLSLSLSPSPSPSLSLSLSLLSLYLYCAALPVSVTVAPTCPRVHVCCSPALDDSAVAQGRGHYFCIGDLFRVYPNGLMLYLGRFDDQINLGGLRVEPGEVEAAIREAAVAEGIDVKTVAVVARGLELCAFTTPSLPDARSAFARLQARIIETLPVYHVPIMWASVDAMPTTPNGKVSRKELRAWPLKGLELLTDVPGRPTIFTPTE